MFDMKLYKKYQLRKSVVVFLDILGFSNQVSSSCSSGDGSVLLKKLSKAIREAKTAFSFYYPPPLSCPVCEIKIFTDNIVIGFPIPNGISINTVIENATTHIAAYQCSLINDGFFIRGGITFGEHYMDSNTVFGAALIAAHNLEQLANSPRIIFDPSINNYLNTNSSLVSYDNIAGVWMINYLDMTKHYSSGPIKRLEKHRDFIVNNLSQFNGNLKVYPKYGWVKEYHNEYCIKNYLSKSDLIIVAADA